MQEPHSPSSVLRKLVLFASLGFATVLLFGPVVAVLSVVLSFAMVLFSFALVGFLVWSLFQLVLHGRQRAWEHISALGREVQRLVPAVGARVMRVARFPLRVMAGTATGIRRGAGFVWRKTWWATRLAGSVGSVAVTGILVGVLVGAAAGAHNHDMATTIPMNALFGGLMGLGVWVAMTVMEKKQSVPTTPQGLSQV